MISKPPPKKSNFLSYIIRNENIEINSNEREYENDWRQEWSKNDKLVLKIYAAVENVWRNLITTQNSIINPYTSTSLIERHESKF